MNQDLSALTNQIERLVAEVDLLKAQHTPRVKSSSPWVSLQEAATRLNFSSPRALKNRIKSGRFPPDCYREEPTVSGKRSIFMVNVDRYIKLLN